MACSIIRNKETNEIEKVLAPNGKESILYSNILNVIENKEEALKAWAQVYTPSFKAWFGDWEKEEGSKVVDSNGEPLLVYHGTGNKFDEFDKTLRGETTGRSITGEFDSENAFFFSNNENVSFNYAIMARQKELEFIASSLIDLRSSFISSEKKQEIYNNLRKESTKFASYIDGLKSKGLNQQQIMEKVTELSVKYSKLSREYSRGGSISNPRRYYRNVKEHVSRLIENKENILRGNYDVKSIYDGKTLRTTDKNNKNLAIYDDGLIIFNEEAFPEISSLQRKKITELSSNDFDKLMNAFLKTVKQGEEKIAEDLKKGGFTPEIMPVFLNARNVVKKDFEGEPFVMQIDGKGAANEASKLTLKAKEEGKDGIIFENIKDPELANNYGVFEPNQIKSLYNKGQFSKKTNNIYNQLEGVPASKASKETIEKIKKLMENSGVSLSTLQDYLKGNPDVNAKGVAGLADLVKGIIAIAEGKEDVALTEEYIHIATAILEQVNPQLITNLISKISQYKIYNIVLAKYSKNPAYQLPNGKPDIRKIKKEAVDKLIAEMIINMSEGSTEFPELMEREKRNIVQQMWDAILDAIRVFYKKGNINLFEETAQRISEGNLGARYYTQAKPGVQEIFNSNPELASIGTPQQYSAYLDSIFPDSKVKDIVYHGGPKRIETKFNDNLTEDGNFFKGIFFSNSLNYIKQLGKDFNKNVSSVTPAIINSVDNFKSQEPLQYGAGQYWLFEQYDSVQGKDAGQKIEGDVFAVRSPEQVHILGSKQDVEGFKTFIQTAPAEFQGEGVFFQLEENEKVNGAFNKFKDMNDRMNFVDATETEKRHYTFDGEKLDKTVTTLKGPKDIEQTPDNIAKKEWGTEGHNYLEEYIRTNLIDENGYALPIEQRKDIEIDSPIKQEVRKAVKTFADELVASYKPGTRFLLESMVANLQTKEKIGSRIDFMAFEPIINSKGESDVRIDILDWKFAGFNTEKNKDVPIYNQKDWKEQMGEYTKMAYNLGIERNQLRKTRMIPFVLNYRYAIKGDKASGLYPSSVEIGKLDTTQETNIYLLPVATDFESTGNEKVDKLLASLRKMYDKIYISYVSPEEKFTKITKLDQLSLAIRNLHLKLNFFPIYDVAVSFLNDVKNTIKEFENIDYTTLSKEELIAKLQKIDEYQTSANKFIGLDEIYLSHISKEDMSPEDKKLLDNFGRVTISTKRALEEMLELQKAYVVQYAIKEGIAEESDDVLKAERVVSSLDKNFLETSKLAPAIIKLAAKVYLKAKSVLNINFSKAANDYSKMLIPLEEEARSKGKSAFEMIGRVTDKGLRLIKKLDSEFLKQIKEAKEKENKQFLLDNLDVEKYKSLVDPIIEKTLNDLDRTQFSLDEEEDAQKREWRKQQIKNTLDITSKTFDGYKNYTFDSYYKKAMKEEGHYSSDFLEMSKSENALRVWQFFTALNEKAYKLGYLDKQGLSFFPLVEATTLQKMMQSGNILKETKDFFKDMYSINPNEEQLYAKTDDETGELKRMIPKYFTRTNKDAAQLSKDLNKVGLIWIKSLMEYETTKELEYPLLTMHAVEQSKGTLITDAKGDVIFEGSTAKEREENENAMFFQSVLDDYLYGITENLNSMGNILMTSTASKLTKDQGKVEGGVVSAKKVLKTGDTYLRMLALGLKPLLGLANFVGANVQSFISSSGIYDKGEFIKNVGKVILPFNQGINLIERALIDTLVPLTGEDPLIIKQRLIAEKKSYTNYLSTWTFSDVMMTTNSFGEKRVELANALSMIDNSIVINGKIINVKQYLKAKDREAKKGMAFEERRALEKSFDERAKQLKEGDNTLKKLSKMVNDELVIEGVSVEELAKFRMAVIDNSRNITGQMSYEDKMGFRRDTLFNSFMMFKGWIPKQLSVRYKEITKNTATDEWEYGRFRAFFSTLRQIGIKNITDLRDIYLGNDKGLSIINEMLEEKKRTYFLKTGKELKITPEEYQDLIRTQVNNMYKELALIVGILGLLITAKIVAPDDDEDDLTKNRYKYFAKAINKISDELLFYVNPASADEMTRGSIIPSLGLLSKVKSLFEAIIKEVYYNATDNDTKADKTYPLKYFLNIFPGAAQWQNEVLPYYDPEGAKERGIRVSAESRAR
jgi:hypothetical protein